LSKVADGKRTTGYADEDFIAGAMATAKKLHRRRNEAVCRSYFREIKLDTTNTLWSDLADRCLRNLKKSKLKTYTTVGICWEIMPIIIRHILLLLKKLLLAGKRV
jgi:hypothetical protein